MSGDQGVAREILLERILDATTLSEIEGARQALREWVRAHPGDEGMSIAFEQLSLLEDAAREEAGRRRQSELTTP